MTTPDHPYASGSTMRKAHKTLSDRLWAVWHECEQTRADHRTVLGSSDVLAYTALEALTDAGYEIVPAANHQENNDGQ